MPPAAVRSPSHAFAAPWIFLAVPASRPPCERASSPAPVPFRIPPSAPAAALKSAMNLGMSTAMPAALYCHPAAAAITRIRLEVCVSHSMSALNPGSLRPSA